MIWRERSFCHFAISDSSFFESPNLRCERPRRCCPWPRKRRTCRRREPSPRRRCRRRTEAAALLHVALAFLHEGQYALFGQKHIFSELFLLVRRIDFNWQNWLRFNNHRNFNVAKLMDGPDLLFSLQSFPALPVGYILGCPLAVFAVFLFLFRQQAYPSIFSFSWGMFF